MSLPKRLYQIYRKVCQCNVVRRRNNFTDEDLQEFQNLLNEAQPPNDNSIENAYQQMTKFMYYSNPVGFVKYLSDVRNRVAALILWTESKYITSFFRLTGYVYIHWDKQSKCYIVSRYNPAVKYRYQHSNGHSKSVLTRSVSQPVQSKSSSQSEDSLEDSLEANVLEHQSLTQSVVFSQYLTKEE